MTAHRLIAAIALGAASLAAQPQPAPADWIKLFNGKDLKDWRIKITGHELNQNFNDTFRVENGVLKVAYDKYSEFTGNFGHIFYKDPFSYYKLVVEYRFTGEQAPKGPAWAFRNSGVMIHSQDPATMTKDQDFPISIEIQFLGGAGKGPRSTLNLCTPGTNVVMDGKLVTTHCINSKSKTYDGDQWVRAEMEVHGNETIKHIVDGETVLQYEKAQIGGGSVNRHDPAVKQDGKMLEGGYIALQAESHPVEFRRVELLNLAGCMDKKAKNYRPHFVKDDKAACKY